MQRSPEVGIQLVTMFRNLQLDRHGIEQKPQWPVLNKQ